MPHGYRKGNYSVEDNYYDNDGDAILEDIMDFGGSVFVISSGWTQVEENPRIRQRGQSPG